MRSYKIFPHDLNRGAMQLEIKDLPKHLLPPEGNKMGALVYAMTFLNDSIPCNDIISKLLA